MLSERRASFRPQPKETVPYEVKPTDTIEGISARFDITPSELVNINKLSSRFIFPGQVIYIPEKKTSTAPVDFRKISATSTISSSSSAESPKPGHVERIPKINKSCEEVFGSAADDTTSADLISCLHQDVVNGKKESLRINSKYVTDGEGVVSGVLIVTRNHIFFDPNVSDSLVIEYGMDKYGVGAPMSWIVKAALYSDIFRMRKDASGKNVNVYHSKAVNVKKSRSYDDGLSKSETTKQKHRYSSTDISTKRRETGISGSNSFQENLSKIAEHADDAEEDEEPTEQNMSKSSTTVPPSLSDNTLSTDENKNCMTKKPLSASSSIDSDDDVGLSEQKRQARKSSMSDDDGVPGPIDLEPTKKKSGFEKTKNKFHKHLKRMSITDSLLPNFTPGRRMSLPLFSSLSDNKEKNSTTKKHSPSVNNCDKASEDSNAGGFTYINMVEEKPELFAPLDKLIPRPAASFCNTPLYLCLRMGEPINQSAPTTNPILHFSQKMKPEYWFSIPKDNVDCLYNFFLRWCPEKYGEIDNIDYQELGYIPIESEELEPEEDKCSTGQRRASWAFPWRRKSKEVSEMIAASTSSPEDWEFLDYMGHIGSADHVPELLTPSTILSNEQILEIGKKLPARALNAWSLIYSTTAHGFSLKTMYRKMHQYESPVLIVIENRSDDIFGALLSSPLKMSDHFYGTGESFLFTFSPEFKVFHWSGSNNYFIKGNVDSFLVGSSEGHFGLWLDDDLYRGRTNSCETFNNDPLCSEEDFVVKSIEAWGFP